MASSRLERIGTIHSRITGLIKTGALKWENRPLWYDIYEAFPPKEEPSYDRPVPQMPLRNIFYNEDKIRAIFHRSNKQVGTFNMLNNESRCLTQRFVNVYKKLEAQYEGTRDEQKLYEEAIEMLKNERETLKETSVPEEESISLSSAFKKALSTKDPESPIRISIKDIFKN